MKSLEKDRSRRYETANGFAADVQRYLADEAVQACPPSVGYRMRKFARRNMGVLTAVTLVFFALAIGIMISTWQAVRATKAERLAQERLDAEISALKQTEKARKEAVANLDKARAAVDQMLTRVGDEEGMFANDWALAPMRRALLEDALRFYQGFLEHKSNDALLRAETGLAFSRVGEISVYLFADQVRAKEAFAQAVPLLEQAIIDFPTQLRFMHALGRCHNRRAEALAKEGLLDEAEQEHRRALAQFEKELGMTLDPQQNRMCRQELGYTYSVMGAELAPKKPIEAEDAFRQAIDLAEALDAEYPNVLVYLRYRAFGYRDLADLVRARAPMIAVTHYQRSAELFENSAARFPQHPLGLTLNGQAADTCLSLRDLLYHLGRDAEALEAHAEAVRLLQLSAERYEERSAEVLAGHKMDFRDRAASEYAKLARHLLALRRCDEAVAAGRKAIELKSDNAEANHSLARALATCADLGLRDVGEALGWARKAIDLDPKHGAYWSTLGVVQYRLGDWATATATLEKSIELSGEESPDGFFVAMAHWQTGEREKAREWFDKADTWMSTNQPKNEELHRYRAEAAELLELNEKKQDGA
jgi:eukaryotic-like serine/threonine-protein kinase